MGPRAGEHEGHIGPRAGKFHQSLVPPLASGGARCAASKPRWRMIKNFSNFERSTGGAGSASAADLSLLSLRPPLPSAPPAAAAP